jgi:myo-inositol 2-dehydrogenase / D-chiro-inositol 1-dehydrogenase
MRIGLAGTGRIGAFHAKTLTTLPGVDDLVLADLDTAVAQRVADDLGVSAAPSIDALLGSGLDAFVITAGTAAHAELLEAAIARDIPTFCEKPVALDLERTIALTELEATSGVPVHIGFQRRFDSGYRRVRDAVASGELGFVHTVRAATMDQTPPPAAYLATSGGIFRDCNVHDFDILRFVTGREVTRVFATGANKGEEFFTEAGDVDTAAATLVLDDGTLAVVTSTRYNGAGHDVRMEVHGSKGTLGVGHDTALAISSAEPGIEWPPGPRHWSFMERFLPAYVTELTAFVEVARGAAPSPCTVADALEAFRTAEACARSLSSGAPVDLVDIPTVRSDLSVRG